MPETVKYEVKFHPAAFKEYERLDHTVAEIVDKKLAALETRAEEIGKPLSGNLSGYREIKLREAGSGLSMKYHGEIRLRLASCMY